METDVHFFRTRCTCECKCLRLLERTLNRLLTGQLPSTKSKNVCTSVVVSKDRSCPMSLWIPHLTVCSNTSFAYILMYWVEFPTLNVGKKHLIYSIYSIYINLSTSAVSEIGSTTGNNDEWFFPPHQAAKLTSLCPSLHWKLPMTFLQHNLLLSHSGCMNYLLCLLWCSTHVCKCLLKQVCISALMR